MRLHWSSILMVCLPLLAGAQDRKKSDALFNKGLQYFSQNKIKEAVKAFDLSIEADSANYHAWIKRGFMKGMNGDFEGEMMDYNHVINYDPSHVYAYISRGGALNRLKDYKSAVIDFNKAIELDPSNQEAYNNRGFAFKALGDTDAACRDWNTSKQLGNKEAGIILKNNYCK